MKTKKYFLGVALGVLIYVVGTFCVWKGKESGWPMRWLAHYLLGSGKPLEVPKELIKCGFAPEHLSWWEPETIGCLSAERALWRMVGTACLAISGEWLYLWDLYDWTEKNNVGIMIPGTAWLGMLGQRWRQSIFDGKIWFTDDGIVVQDCFWHDMGKPFSSYGSLPLSCLFTRRMLIPTKDDIQDSIMPESKHKMFLGIDWGMEGMGPIWHLKIGDKVGFALDWDCPTGMDRNVFLKKVETDLWMLKDAILGSPWIYQTKSGAHAVWPGLMTREKAIGALETVGTQRRLGWVSVCGGHVSCSLLNLREGRAIAMRVGRKYDEPDIQLIERGEIGPVALIHHALVSIFNHHNLSPVGKPANEHFVASY